MMRLDTNNSMWLVGGVAAIVTGITFSSIATSGSRINELAAELFTATATSERALEDQIRLLESEIQGLRVELDMDLQEIRDQQNRTAALLQTFIAASGISTADLLGIDQTLVELLAALRLQQLAIQESEDSEPATQGPDTPAPEPFP